MRGVIGSLFVGHGTQKLFGWFDGTGIEGTSGMMGSLELRPPRRHAVLAGLTESVGGALLVLGALTPFATSGPTAIMVTAIRKVHAALFGSPPAGSRGCRSLCPLRWLAGLANVNCGIKGAGSVGIVATVPP